MLPESWCDPATRWTLLAPAGSVPIDVAVREDALQALQALPSGTEVTLAGKRGLRRIARQAGVLVSAEYVALPSTSTPVAVAGHGPGLRWVAHSVLTVPSGRSRGHLAMTVGAMVARRWPRLLGAAGHHVLVGRLQ
jgi:hypothetical protein